MVNKYRILENNFIDCPQLDDIHLPIIKSALIMLELQYSDEDSEDVIEVGCYLRWDQDNQAYIDIYFYNPKLFEDKYMRMIWKQGFRMEEDEEVQFISLCRSYDMNVDKQLFACFQDEIRIEYPEYTIQRYTAKDISRYLENLYFIFHRSGTREILYKSKLENIAYNLFEIEEYNLFGGSPSEIFNMPINLLRILNQRLLIDRMHSESSRNQAMDVYSRFSDYIDVKKSIPGTYQWRYLEEYQEFGDDGQAAFNKKLYARMQSVLCENSFWLYKKYMQMADRLGDMCPRSRLPKADELLTAVYEMERLEELISRQDILDIGVSRHNDPYYEYEDDDYVVIMPQTSYQIYMEGMDQDNCVAEYIETVSEGESMIAFLRKKDNPDKSYITMEIQGTRIKQALTRFNGLPSVKDCRFIEKYAKEKWLTFDISYILEMSGNTEGFKFDEEFLEYMKDYESRMTSTGFPVEDIEYTQLTIADVFPLLVS